MDDHVTAQDSNTKPAGEDTTDTGIKPLISVIVPIYNVEKYVRKCLDSLKGQTLKEIEIICIDDGSTDGSGRIADEYCNTDEDGRGDCFPLFRVIHTENRGLSAARNRGIDESRGAWLMFVDSDDWVDESFCEIPLKAAIVNNADMVIFRSDSWKNGNKRKFKKSDSIPVGLIDEFTAHEYGGVTAWNKLYKKNLFKEIRYPEGSVHEDAATTHMLVHIAKGIILLQDCLYHHVYRKNSIARSPSISNRRDALLSTKERFDFLTSIGYGRYSCQTGGTVY